MVVPDFDLICEIMLVAEGFQEARLLARKFITLYQLCRELLSKQDHYDWGLRAIKSVLVVAGKLKRDDPGRAEDQVLMRALRDFNIPKIVTDDVPVFMGLIGKLVSCSPYLPYKFTIYIIETKCKILHQFSRILTFFYYFFQLVYIPFYWIVTCINVQQYLSYSLLRLLFGNSF